MEESWQVVEGKDTGSLSTGPMKLSEGDAIKIEGEDKERRVTAVFGSQRNGWHAAFKGQGAVPTGRLRWRLVAASAGGGSSNASIEMSPPSSRADLSKTPLRELLSMLPVGQVWAILTVLVALTVGSFSLGRSAVQRPSNPTGASQWLVIEGVESSLYEIARITVSVNGLDYISYPSVHVWSRLGPGMPKEKFPLPQAPKEFQLTFGAYLSNSGPEQPVAARCQEADSVPVAEVPTSIRRCELFLSEGPLWSDAKVGTVSYRVIGG